MAIKSSSRGSGGSLSSEDLFQSGCSKVVEWSPGLILLPTGMVPFEKKHILFLVVGGDLEDIGESPEMCAVICMILVVLWYVILISK